MEQRKVITIPASLATGKRIFLPSQGYVVVASIAYISEEAVIVTWVKGSVSGEFKVAASSLLEIF